MIMLIMNVMMLVLSHGGPGPCVGAFQGMDSDGKQLPNDLWLLSLAFLSGPDLCNCSRVNVKFNALSNEDGMWKTHCQMRWRRYSSFTSCARTL